MTTLHNNKQLDMNENELMQKLMHSKKIMDVTDEKSGGGRRDTSQSISRPMVEDFDMPQVKYNIPQEFLQEQQPQIPYLSSAPRENTKPVGVPTIDAIKNSKLPDEIKRLMIENPIAQPQNAQVSISNELVEKASRLMKADSSNYIPESAKTTKKTTTATQSTNLDYNEIKKMVKLAVEESLRENGMLTESTEKSNELFSFKVGKHIFEGKVTKIKKVS